MEAVVTDKMATTREKDDSRGEGGSEGEAMATPYPPGIHFYACTIQNHKQKQNR